MKLIETYKELIDHQSGYTVIGPVAFAEINNLKRLKEFVFPYLDQLKLNEKVPDELLKLGNGWMIDLSYSLNNRFYPLYLRLNSDQTLRLVNWDLIDNSEDLSNEQHPAWMDFMAK